MFSRCASRKNLSSADPGSTSRASPPIVADIELTAYVLRFNKREASDERCTSGAGKPPDMRRPDVGGRWETQSCTSKDTDGLDEMLVHFLDDGFVVMMIRGREE